MQILYLTVLSLSALGHVAAVQYTSSSSGSNSTTISTPTPSQSSGSTRAPPTFEFLFGGQIPEAGRFSLDGPFGRRDDVPFANGTLIDANGTEVVSVVRHSSAGHGIHPANGYTYADGVFVIQFLDDQSYAFIKARGVGAVGSRITLHLEIETAAHSTRKDFSH